MFTIQIDEFNMSDIPENSTVVSILKMTSLSSSNN